MWRYWFKKKKERESTPIQAESESSTIDLQCIGETCSVPISIKMALCLTNATTLSPAQERAYK